MRHGGKLLIDQLEIQGCDRAFCVPGESFLAALDGLHDSQIRTITCRQEGGAAMMAEAHGKLTGRPGICFVTRGPGATNASIGVHIARQDSTPLILFVGLPATSMQDREAFQEFDLAAMFGALAKWAGVIPSAQRIPEYISRAFYLAQSGRPGPVVLGLPEDVLSSQVEAANCRMALPATPAPSREDMELLKSALERSARPVMLVGGPGWSAPVAAQIASFAERNGIAVASAFRYQDYIDNRHPNYVGHLGIAPDPALAELIHGADLLIAIGARLGEMTTSGYRLLSVPNPRQMLVHVHPGADELGSVYRPELAICACAENFASALSDLAISPAKGWRRQCEQARQSYEDFIEPRTTPGDVKLEEVVATLSETLPDDAIICNGAGNYAAWVNRYFVYKRYRSQLANTAGAMGYGVPAAIAAKLAEPDRDVIAFAGDGCFLMNGQELATARQFGANIVVIVANNGSYGTIRMHQEKTYPGRVTATSLNNPSFSALAESYGAFGQLVESTLDFRAAFERAQSCARPALIELKTDLEAISPSWTLSEIHGSG